MHILYEDNHLLVVLKPINMPVQADHSKDLDLLTTLKQYIKETYQKPGNVYLGLVHRLDRPVSGIMVFAKTSKAAERLSKQIRDHQMEKKYYAVLDGAGIKTQSILKDKLEKNRKENKSFISKKGKEAELSYTVLDIKDKLTLVDVDLVTGRSHQIRLQFASRNYPLYGDQKYNNHAKAGEQIALFAYELSFHHPITKEKITFTMPLPERYPFSLFQTKKQKKK